MVPGLRDHVLAAAEADLEARAVDGDGKSSARSGGAGLARSMASCGNSVSINATWCGRSACPRGVRKSRAVVLGSEWTGGLIGRHGEHLRRLVRRI
jgi:hypothetical protein